ncbi:MAG: hypothetical protein ACM34I_05140, partial [bacterium]
RPTAKAPRTRIRQLRSDSASLVRAPDRRGPTPEDMRTAVVWMGKWEQKTLKAQGAATALSAIPAMATGRAWKAHGAQAAGV